MKASRLAMCLIVEFGLLSGTLYCQPLERFKGREYRCNFIISPKLPPYTFRLIINPDTSALGAVNAVSRIEVGRADKPKVVQIIRRFEECEPFQPDFFSCEDLNFDGYKDILLEYSDGSGGGSYNVWLFNPKTGRFDYNKEISQLTDPTPDSASRTLTSYYEDGACCGTVSKYRFHHGKLDPISEEETIRGDEPNRLVQTTKLFGHGKVVSVRIDTLLEK